MKDPIVGIDLGTTNSVVSIVDETNAPVVLADDSDFKIQPSVVSFHPNGSVIVGAGAKQRKVIDAKNTVYSAKRLIGRTFNSREVQAATVRMPYTIKEGVNQQPVIVTRAGEFAIPEISAIILDHMRSIAKKRLGGDVSRTVITVPANFTDAQRSATATAGAIAGLTVVRVLNEPTAAALAYGHNRNLNQTIAVYDFGGGTFDVTVLKLHDQIYEVLGTAGDSFLGGDDIDEKLVDQMVHVFLQKERVDLRNNELSMQRLRAVAEQAKIELSRRSRAIIKIDEIAYGDRGAPLNLELEITREEFINRISSVVERTFPVCAEAVKLAGLNPAQIDDVVLVGGTTKMPYVRERVTAFFGKPARTDVNPDEAVALGAGLQAVALERILGGAQRRRRPTERTAVAPPGVPMEAKPPRPTTTKPMGRVTAPRVATETTMVDDGEPTTLGDEEPTGIRPANRAGTAPMGAVQPPRTVTERRARPGSHSDRVRPPPIPAGAAVARITRPGTAPPKPPQTTLMGAPAPTLPRSEPIDLPPPGGFDDSETGIPTRVHPDVPADEQDFFEPTTPRPKPPPPTPPPTAEPPPMAAGPSAVTMMPFAGDDAPEPKIDLVPLEPASQPTQFDLGIGSEPQRPAPPTAHAGAAPVNLSTPSQPTMMSGAAPGIPQVQDVTPHTLGIGTVAGYCEELIGRNSRVPMEKQRMFSTSKDLQQIVRIRVCQGESRRIDENVVLGDIVLEGLDPRPRGETQIEVTFHIDASGILHVTARDSKTGQEQRINLNTLGAQSPDQIAAARDRFRDIVQ